MGADDDAVTARPGSYADLARRMDKIEDRHSSLEKTVERVELNQKHADELAKLRFDALDAGVAAQRAQLTEFMRRIEGIISGEVVLPQQRQGEQVLKEYLDWRKTVEERLAPEGQSISAALRERDLQRAREHATYEKDIKAAMEIAQQASEVSERNRIWIATASGAVALVVLLMNLFAPALRHALGLG